MSNVAARVLSAVPVTGPLGIDNILLSLDSKMPTTTRVTSGVLLFLKVAAIVVLVVLGQTKKPDLRPSLACRECKRTERNKDESVIWCDENTYGSKPWEDTWNNKEFRTWYRNQGYLRPMPRTVNEFAQACNAYTEDAKKRQDDLDGWMYFLVGMVVILWVVGIVVAFRAKRT